MVKKSRNVRKVAPKINHDFFNAKHVISALVSGIDPDSGEELSGNPILHRVGVLRSLLAAMTALDMTAARAGRRAQLPSAVGTPWTSDEETQLVSAFQRGDAIEGIAESHNRTVRAIEARLERLGLITEGHRTTADFPLRQK